MAPDIWSTLDEKDRTTIPRRVRKHLSLTTHDRIRYELCADHVRMTRFDGPPPPRTWRDWIGPVAVGAGLVAAAVADRLKKK